jgi:hypothetical protein
MQTNTPVPKGWLPPRVPANPRSFGIQAIFITIWLSWSCFLEPFLGVACRTNRKPVDPALIIVIYRAIDGQLSAAGTLDRWAPPAFLQSFAWHEDLWLKTRQFKKLQLFPLQQDGGFPPSRSANSHINGFSCVADLTAEHMAKA